MPSRTAWPVARLPDYLVENHPEPFARVSIRCPVCKRYVGNGMQGHTIIADPEWTCQALAVEFGHRLENRLSSGKCDVDKKDLSLIDSTVEQTELMYTNAEDVEVNGYDALLWATNEHNRQRPRRPQGDHSASVADALGGKRQRPSASVPCHDIVYTYVS